MAVQEQLLLLMKGGLQNGKASVTGFRRLEKPVEISIRQNTIKAILELGN